MRISEQYLNLTLTNTTNAAMAKMLDIATQIASGKKISSASDDPMSATRIMSMNAQMAKIEDWSQNIAKAKEEAKSSYDALNIFEQQLSAIDGLAIEVVNGGLGDESIEAIRKEIEARTKALASIANTKYGDDYIFAGTNTQRVPYIMDDDLNVTYQGTASDGQWQRRLEIFENEEVTINTLGANVFGDGTTGVFATLKTINDALKDDPPRIEDVRAELDNLKEHLSVTAGAMASASNNINHVEAVGSINDNIYANLTESKSNLENVDIITASSELAKAQSTLDASLQVTAAMLNRPSLLDYL